MNCLDLTLTTVAENLALDEALLLEAETERSGEVLRFWEWPTRPLTSPTSVGWAESSRPTKPVVILGAGGRLAEDVDEAACQADDVWIGRRSSGGGTVLLSTGCLCYSLVLSHDRDPALREIHSSFRFILGRIRDAIAPLTTHHSPLTSRGIELAGISDLAIAGRKFSGNSQQRKRRFLLHHGTILYALDTGLVDRYLRMPARQPEYREQRKHSEFLTNMRVDCDTLKLTLSAAWSAISITNAWPQDAVRQLAEDKYARPEWIRRR
jgi:lipoate-protein ligase A